MGLSALCSSPPSPIISQFLLMKLRPFRGQAESPARKLPLNNLKRVDVYLSFVLSIYCVKMRRRVIVVVHPNDDSKKDAERWHQWRLYETFYPLNKN